MTKNTAPNQKKHSLSFLSGLWSVMRTPLGVACLLFAGLLVLGGMTGSAMATGDDIDTATTSAAGYWTAIKDIAIGVALFLVGRKLLKKI